MIGIALSLGALMLQDRASEPVSPAPSVATLTRHADPVAYLDGETREQRILFFWDKMVGLRVGDGLRQGVAGISDLHFHDDMSELRLYGQTHAIVEAATPEAHVIRVLDLRRALIHSRAARLELHLPGGTVLTATETVFRLSLDELDRRWVVQNSGPGEVRVNGPVVVPDVAAITAGMTTQIPLLEQPPAENGGPVLETVDAWQGRTIRLGPGVESTKNEGQLELGGEGVAKVGGARIRVMNGRTTTVWKPRP